MFHIKNVRACKPSPAQRKSRRNKWIERVFFDVSAVIGICSIVFAVAVSTTCHSNEETTSRLNEVNITSFAQFAGCERDESLSAAQRETLDRVQVDLQLSPLLVSWLVSSDGLLRDTLVGCRIADAAAVKGEHWVRAASYETLNDDKVITADLRDLYQSGVAVKVTVQEWGERGVFAATAENITFKVSTAGSKPSMDYDYSAKGFFYEGFFDDETCEWRLVDKGALVWSMVGFSVAGLVVLELMFFTENRGYRKYIEWKRGEKKDE